MTGDAFITDLATFDDRWTMRHTRTYPHPIERVWEAITSTEHINRWLLPTASVDPVEGGRCSFTWGGPRGSEQVGVVRDVSPPTGIVYDLDTSYLRFELTPVAGGTRLDFVHGFEPGAHIEPVERHGGDQPAGADSPWRPDFSMGFHVMLDALAILLASPPADGENVLAWLARTEQDTDDVVANRTQAYRELIATRCPPAG
jgi:uncharacterized protein YndB with AHSA1/START domain